MSQTTLKSSNGHDRAFEPIIVADIGGTNARFAVVTEFDLDTNQFAIDHQFTFPSAEFQSFESALAAFLATLTIKKPSRACFAVAGPIKGQQVYLTNLGWNFNTQDIKSQFDFKELAVINDFAAFAFAAPHLSKEDNIQIKTGQADPNANIAVLGPGTGFGAACHVKDIHGSAVMSCEAGHISLAAVTELDRQLLQVLKESTQHVSVETVFSGPGLARLYKAMAQVKGVPAEDLNAAQISAKAHECDVCDATLNQFCDWIGSVAGDIALTFGALGGVFIGGGILPRMTERLISSRFVERFTEKGIMSQYAGQIPVTLVVQDNIPLIGAAACLHDRDQFS
ncbi:glucokinase [Pseudoalteromonas luteoviolacea]|uniref:Glucokinase n=1 Tax=Pseudoalteromonas luteoviolacea TaxID=43657 RepID=A0A1C0TU60_9GAMM|nr:glucokinase [Pseudoalteromonas luteoviolacea]MBQ4812832.1 glucokinase [Pseudoalteromonas luteoviolacea]OCQ22853.1 glucokinase [Pseudoalteromonas luteoviolacea]